MAKPTGRDIRQLTLKEATHAICARGVNGFSYGEIARRLEVRAPSLHHHFPRKNELIREATERYRVAFRDAVSSIDATSAADRIRQYSALFLAPATEGVLCLCGVAVAGWEDLDDATRAHIIGFFDDESAWLAEQFTQARADGELSTTVDPQQLAVAFIAALEGALLLARTDTHTTDALAIGETLLLLAGVAPAEQTSAS